MRDIADADWDAFTLEDHGLFNVGNRFGLISVGTKKAFTTNDKLHASRFDRLCPDVKVGPLDRHGQLVQRDVVETKFVRVDFDLILPNIATNRRDFADTFDRLQFVLDDEVLQAAKLGEIHAFFGRL